ncbi:MAG TPA: hypothetical protein VG710_05960 [Opitutus sp.]|nr:hypothetical protein [Opitutus sp.]
MHSRFSLSSIVTVTGLLVAVAVQLHADDFWTQDASFHPVFEDFRGNVGGVTPVALPDGGVVVSTSYAYINGEAVTGLTRIASDGTVDDSFHPDLPANAFVAGVYADGRLLVGVPANYPEPGHLYRLLSDGTIDPGFAAVEVNGTSFTARVAADGRIWLFGDFDTVDGASHPKLALLKADGTLEAAFAPAFTAQGVDDLAVQADGKAVAVGSFAVAENTTAWIVRFDAAGALDSTFVPGMDPSGGVTKTVTALTGGKILVTARTSLVRLNADGSVDASYAPTIQADALGHPLPNGHVYFVQAEGSNHALHRLNADGTVDGSFGFATTDNGRLAVPATWDETVFYVGAAVTLARDTAQAALSKLDATGTLVASFAPRFSFDATNLTLVGRDSAGRYLMTGSFSYVNGVQPSPLIPNSVWLNSDGTLDAAHPVPAGVVPIGVEPDGHFTATGDFEASSQVARFAPDGTQLATFPITVTAGTTVTPDATGRVYVTDDSTAIKRYLADGTLDSSFSADLGAHPTQVLPTADGKVFVKTGGSTTVSTIEVTRLLATGEVDPSFAKITLQYAPSNTVFGALPEGGLLMIQIALLKQYTDYLHFVRYDSAGQAVYTYDGAADPLVLAGVMLDSLLATGGGEWDLHTQVLFDNQRMPLWTDVRSDGQASMVTDRVLDAAGPLVRYLRTTLTSPSVEAAPVIGSAPADLTVNQDSYAFFTVQALGLQPFSYQWSKGGVPIDGATGASLSINPAEPADAGSYTVKITNSAGSVTSDPVTLTVTPVAPAAPQITGSPSDAAGSVGSNVLVQAFANGHPLPNFQGERNGVDIAGATNEYLSLTNLQPADAGLYAMVATNDSGTVTSWPGIVGIATTERAVGDGSIVASDVPHPNGRHYDQVLMTGAAAAITARPGEVTRTSFIDLNDNIVQVEFSGAGTLTLVLDDAGEPAPPVNYSQNVNYVKGHVGLVITGSDETTNVSVFAVGHATAFDPTGAYDILQAPSDTNVPADNGSPLFAGHETTNYNGTAQIAFIAIGGQRDFGGVRTANVHFYASKGLTGLYAPRTSFHGPVYIGEITAFDDATPVIMLGSPPSDARITGGNLAQDNGKPVEVSGLIQLNFTAGSDAEGRALPAQNNRAVLEQDGQDVTSQIVVNPGQ